MFKTALGMMASLCSIKYMNIAKCELIASLEEALYTNITHAYTKKMQTPTNTSITIAKYTAFTAVWHSVTYIRCLFLDNPVEFPVRKGNKLPLFVVQSDLHRKTQGLILQQLWHDENSSLSSLESISAKQRRKFCSPLTSKNNVSKWLKYFLDGTENNT